MTNKIFISFPIEDSTYRDFLKGQANNAKSPFDFTDMSVHNAWDSDWKTKCRARIKGCDGMIAIITAHTYKADGQIWEIKCAVEESIQILCIKTSEYSPSANTLNLIGNKKVYNWDWTTIKNFMDKL